MNRALFVGAFLSLLGAAASVSADEGVFKAPVDLDGSGPFYRLTIPVEIHLAAAYPDLRDLVVEDATGAAVSYAIVPRQAHLEEVTTTIEPKWVPLYASPSSPNALTGFRVERRTDGTVAAVVDEAKPETRSRRLRGYLLETPVDRGSYTRLELDWERVPGGIEQVSIDASDDLQDWHSWQHGATIANLEYNGQRIAKRSVDLPGQQARYLRITWDVPELAPKLLGVRLVSRASVTVGPGIAWSKPLLPTLGEGGALDYDLGRDVAADKVRIDLAEDNTLAPVELFARSGTEDAWRPTGNAVVYRLRIDGRTSEEREVPLSRAPLRRLEIRVAQGGHLGAPAPSVEVGIAPLELVLLARGPPPFDLRLGDEALRHETLDIATLVPGFGSASEPPISTAKVDVARGTFLPKPPPKAPPPKPVDVRPYSLWGVLVLGVLALVFLAWRVARATSSDDAPE